MDSPSTPAASGSNHDVPDNKEWRPMTGTAVHSACAIILAGGRSSRMGSDKRTLRINGETLIDALYRQIAPRFGHLIISTSVSGDCPVADARCIADETANRGPLMAICSCLRKSPCDVNFVIACDIPEVDMTLVDRLLSFAHRYDIVVPSFEKERFEPLFAVYNRSVVAVMERQLSENRLRVADCFALCKTLVVPVADTAWYRNLNTPEDFETFSRNRKTG